MFTSFGSTGGRGHKTIISPNTSFGDIIMFSLLFASHKAIFLLSVSQKCSESTRLPVDKNSQEYRHGTNGGSQNIIQSLTQVAMR